jgi:hypothetical protein
MAYEFSMALRASCALAPRMMLAYGVLPRIEDALPAIGAPEVYFHAHTRGMYPPATPASSQTPGEIRSDQA